MTSKTSTFLYIKCDKFSTHHLKHKKCAFYAHQKMYNGDMMCDGDSDADIFCPFYVHIIEYIQCTFRFVGRHIGKCGLWVSFSKIGSVFSVEHSLVFIIYLLKFLLQILISFSQCNNCQNNRKFEL